MTMTNRPAKDFDLQPVLNGARVIVRPIETSDWEGLYAAAADPLIWEQHPASDRYIESVFRNYFEDAINSGSAFTFVDRADDKIIGSSRYHGLDPELGEIEIGWTFLARDYWGGSYNREIKALMLSHAFEFVDTVVFWVGAENTRSRRAVEKIGAVLREGTVTRAESGADPYVVYAMAKADFLNPGNT